MEMPHTCSQQNDDDLDNSAVERTRSGDSSAFEAIVRRYTPLAYSLTYRLLAANREAAEEAVQEIFLKAYRSIGSFHSGQRFFTWFYTIALNHLRSIRRRRRSHPEESTLPIDGHTAFSTMRRNGELPEDRAIAREGERLAQEALLRLPERYREVFLLRHVEGLSSREAADILRLPEATVRTHLFRAREQLKKLLLERQWE
jgi:RNA polymerase sigma-70 factor (ECF subfamily)